MDQRRQGGETVKGRAARDGTTPSGASNARDVDVAPDQDPLNSAEAYAATEVSARSPYATNLVGEYVGKYRVQSLLGSGGMGEVYSAAHTALGNRVAIKVLSERVSLDGDIVGRFFSEAKAAAALKHAGIVEVYDFDQLPDGRPYMVMELLEGDPLAERLVQEGRLSPGATVAILRQVCGALGAAHERGIIHRDVKPENIFLAKREGLDHLLVKVLDFGIARVEGALKSGAKTRGGSVFGTPEYMSPEQAFGKTNLIGPASDIYSLGCVAYQMLTGTVPFPAEGLSFGELMLKHAQEQPVPLRATVPSIPPALEEAVLKALAKEIRDRWESMASFSDAIREAAHGRALTPAVGRPQISDASDRGGGDAPSAPPLIPRPTARATTLSGSAHASLAPPRLRKRRAWGLAAVAFAGIAGASAIAVTLVGHSARQPAVAPNAPRIPSPMGTARPSPRPAVALPATPSQVHRAASASAQGVRPPRVPAAASRPNRPRSGVAALAGRSSAKAAANGSRLRKRAAAVPGLRSGSSASNGSGFNENSLTPPQ